MNSRFAPDVYLGVAEIRDQDGAPCDHLVVMRRMPAGLRLSALVRSGAPVTESLRAVARIIAAQHAASRHCLEIDREGGRDAILGRWQDSFAQVRSLGAELLDPVFTDEAERLADRFLSARKPLFDDRIREGRIVDGHGDLLAEDIFCLPDGPRILDCLEFDDRLRWLDGLDDAAFLAMDLERLGAPSLAEQFMQWYIDFSADSAPGSLHHHYVAYRAFVRAKVACLRLAQGDPQTAGSARRLAELSLRHLRAGAISLVLVGGLPGTGKSTLAAAAADSLGFVVLTSDRIRKELAGMPPGRRATAAYGAGLYTRTWTERTYAEMLGRAGQLLRHGESVILDASWTSAQQRAAAAALARGCAADLVQLRCTAPADVIAERLGARADDVSDADPGIATSMTGDQAPWPDALTVDTGGADAADPGALDSALRLALDAIRPHGPDHTWRPVRPYMLPG